MLQFITQFIISFKPLCLTIIKLALPQSRSGGLNTYTEGVLISATPATKVNTFRCRYGLIMRCFVMWVVMNQGCTVFGVPTVTIAPFFVASQSSLSLRYEYSNIWLLPTDSKFYNINRIKWFSVCVYLYCTPSSVGLLHKVVERPLVADRGNGNQIWRVAASILNKQ
jgi:hypothetical protein